jgi:hypothetical protein
MRFRIVGCGREPLRKTVVLFLFLIDWTLVPVGRQDIFFSFAVVQSTEGLRLADGPITRCPPPLLLDFIQRRLCTERS